ncbi:hypothetical protein MNBD_NITROSPINAE02-1979 [hydrothermal vent metagenome]|uniref:Response regulator of zinc sigma-54-dependent two-component system n=1 Tax=hydrothermal vent metagenome TaxID=652676 RepID=A0A3B1C8M4_9ZZZZ
MENRKIRLLVVDDEEPFRGLLVTRFNRAEFEVTGCASGEKALELARNKTFDVGILDIRMPGISGVDLLKEIKILQPEFEAIIVTGQASIDSAIESMKLGAYDYIAKPCKLLELEMIILKAFEKKLLSEQNSKLKEEIMRRVESQKLIGSSNAMENLRTQIERASAADGTTLLVGESGVGKETAAIIIHRQSARKDYPFITVNCGVLSGGILETELFGHEAEAFLGAGQRKRGIVENAEGGTVFLDEAEQISSAMQVKILRFLDTGGFNRVGGFSEISPNTRLVFATTEDLLSIAKQGKLREDFYYKISGLAINIPPLRERKEDIKELSEYILSHSAMTQGHKKRLAKKAVEALMNYDWPGNVRELANVLERAVSLATKNVIRTKDLPLIFEKKSKTSKSRHLMSLSEMEKEHILFVLDAVNGNISKASRILGVSRPKLYRKIEKYQSGKEA